MWTLGGRVHRAELCHRRNEVEEAGGMEAGESAQVERLVGLGLGVLREASTGLTSQPSLSSCTPPDQRPHVLACAAGKWGH